MIFSNPENQKIYTYLFNAYLVLILIISYSQRKCLLYLLFLFNQQNTHNISYRVKSRGATAIFIAHRLASIQHCDLILVLKDGQIGKYMSVLFKMKFIILLFNWVVPANGWSGLKFTMYKQVVPREIFETLNPHFRESTKTVPIFQPFTGTTH